MTLNTHVMASVLEALFSIKRINHVTADRLNTIVLTNHLACKYRASREFDRVIFLVLF